MPRSGGPRYAPLSSPNRRRSHSPTNPTRSRSRSRSRTPSPSHSYGRTAGDLSPLGQSYRSRSPSPRARANTAPTEDGRPWLSRSASPRQRAESSPTYVHGEKYGARLPAGSLFPLPEGVAQVQLVGVWSKPSFRPTARFERSRFDGGLSPLDAELLPHDATGKPLETTRGTQKWAEYTRSLHDEAALPARLARKPPLGCPWQWLQARELKSTYGQSSTANVAIDLTRVPASVRFFSFTLCVRRGEVGSLRAPQLQVLEGSASTGQVLCTHVASNLGAKERAGREIVMCRLWRLPDDVERGSEGEIWPRSREGSVAERSAGSGYTSPSSLIRQVVGHDTNRIGQRNVAVIDTNRDGTRTPSTHRGARRIGGGWEKAEVSWSGAHWELEILESGDSDPDEHHLRLSPVVPQPDSDSSDRTYATYGDLDIDSSRSGGSRSGPSRRRNIWRSRPGPRYQLEENESDGPCKSLSITGLVVTIVVLFLVLLSAMTQQLPNGTDEAQPLPPLPRTEHKQLAIFNFNASAAWARISDEITDFVHTAELDLPECFDQRPNLVAGMFIFYLCGFFLSCCGCWRCCKNHRKHSKLTGKLPSWLPRHGKLQMTAEEIEIEQKCKQAGVRSRQYLRCSLLCILLVGVSTAGLYLWYLLGGCVAQQRYDECGLPLSVQYGEEARQQHAVDGVVGPSSTVVDAFCCPQLDLPSSDDGAVSVAGPCAFDPQRPDECSEIMAYSSGTVEEPPYPTWQEIAKTGRGQQLCTGTQTVGFDRCRYSFEARTVPTLDPSGTSTAEPEAPPGSRCGFCTGNTPATQQPDIVCDTRHAVLVEHANTTRGRDVAACCVTAGMCTRNSRPDEEPDIICPASQVLRPPTAHHAGWRPGRSVQECCWSTPVPAVVPAAEQNATVPQPRGEPRQAGVPAQAESSSGSWAGQG